MDAACSTCALNVVLLFIDQRVVTSDELNIRLNSRVNEVYKANKPSPSVERIPPAMPSVLNAHGKLMMAKHTYSPNSTLIASQPCQFDVVRGGVTHAPHTSATTLSGR